MTDQDRQGDDIDYTEVWAPRSSLECLNWWQTTTGIDVMTRAELGEAINGDGAALIVTSVKMPLDKQTLPIAFLFCMIRSKRVQITADK